MRNMRGGADRRRAGRGILAGLAAVVAALGIVSAPSAAHAAEIDAITGVTIVEPADGVSVFENFRLEATWAVPDDAMPGDTFTLNFPTNPLVVGITDTFELTTTGGDAVGTCTVSSASITCLLGDYVTTHDNVRGTLSFFAQAQESTEQTTLTFTTGNGVPFTPAIPGGAVGPQDGTPLPTVAQKSGIVTTEGTAEWTVYIPSSQLTEGMVLTDAYTPGMEFLPSTLQMLYIPNADWNEGFPTSQVVLASGTDYTLADSPATSSFTVTMNTPIVADSLYRLVYRSAFPPGAREGDVFTNSISGEGFTTSTSTVVFAGGGGTGEGDGEGSLAILKAVSGAGAALIPTDVEYTVDYSYVDADGTPVAGTLNLVAGTPQTLDGLPEGVVVTLSESAPPAVDGAVWGNPVFSGEGVTVTEGGAQLTVSEGATVSVLLTNPTSVSPPVTPPPSPSTPASPPASTPPATPPATPSIGKLASTGGESGWAPLIGSLLLAAGGVAFALAPLRRKG